MLRPDKAHVPGQRAAAQKQTVLCGARFPGSPYVYPRAIEHSYHNPSKDDFTIKHGDFHSYVNLPDGI